MRLQRHLTLLVLAFFFVAAPVHAATLSLSGSGGVALTTIAVPISVSAGPGESLNAVSVRVSYPADTLTLLSISKSSSIVTLWAAEPSFSNTSGTAALEGVIPNPGFSGQSGRVATLNFRVKRAGTATVSFVNSSVLANDGKGTEILKGTTPVTLILTEAPAQVKSAPPPTELSSLLAPTISFIPTTLTEGTPLVIRGTTYPKSTIRVEGVKNGESVLEETVTSDARGDFSLTTGTPLKAGDYALIFRVTDGEGNTSAPSSPYELSVTKTIPLDAPHLLFDYLPGALVLLLGIGALILVATYGWYRLLTLTGRFRKGQARAERLLHKSLALLRKDIENHVRRLRSVKEERLLTQEEVDFLEEFETDLADADTIVGGEIRDIQEK